MKPNVNFLILFQSDYENVKNYFFPVTFIAPIWVSHFHGTSRKDPYLDLLTPCLK